VTLAPGVRLGPYEILAPLGAGGMGEVYRARDTKLGREVAVKVLPEDFAHSEDRLARFEREARVLASLNHPHVATLHGFEQEGETRFLVMELVEGEDLAARLKRGPLPLREALPLFLQVAEGLEAAHEKGVIHRDLKPANIKVTEDGTVKVLDFGLAKAILPPSAIAEGDLSQSPTQSATHHGEILGTAAYMSPEQAQGKAVDKRTDIWAFGCCLYEALTGDRAFRGDTAPQTLAKILEREPKWDALPRNTPVRIRELLHRCLEKDPKQRLHDVADARLDISAALEEPAGATATPGRDGWWSWWRWGVAGALAGILVGSLVVAPLTRKPAASDSSAGSGVMRTTIQLPTEAPVALDLHAHKAIAVSRSGSMVVYVVGQDEMTQLYLRRLNRFDATAIPGTEGGRHPALSPDEMEVAFAAHDFLKKVSLRDGETTILCEAREVNGITWGGDGSIYFTRHQWELTRVPAEGGEAEAIAYLVTNPFALPGRAGVLVTDWTGGTSPRPVPSIAHVSPDGEKTTLLENGYDAGYVSTGHLLWTRDARVFAAPFDLERLEVTGAPVPVLDHVWTESIWLTSQLAVSEAGTLVYISGEDRSRTIPTWIDRQGREEPLALPAGVYKNFKVSPDGRRIAVHVGGPTNHVYVYDLERETFSRLTLEAGGGYPIWTADGGTVIFFRSSLAFAENPPDRPGPQTGRYWRPELFWQAVDATTGAQRLLSEDVVARIPGGFLAPNGVSPDGTVLAFLHENRDGRGDIWLLRLDGQGVPQPFVVTENNEALASFSPDGHWIAFQSNKTGRAEVFVRPFPEGEGEWPISNGRGDSPRWSPQGDEIFYCSGRRLMVVPVSAGPELRAGKPRILFEREDFGNLDGWPYDVSRDGQRFLIGKTAFPARSGTELQVVVNWFEELKDKMREASQATEPSGQ
jgi:dipeptidyl aminopeptidase/acylaminoacyl peptidase